MKKTYEKATIDVDKFKTEDAVVTMSTDDGGFGGNTGEGEL